MAEEADELLVSNVFYNHKYQRSLLFDLLIGPLVLPRQFGQVHKKKAYAGADADEVAAVVFSTNYSSPT